MQAYRTAAAGTIRRLSSALFGRELLAVEAARASAAERERMLEGRARTLLESQVLVGAIEEDGVCQTSRAIVDETWGDEAVGNC